MVNYCVCGGCTNSVLTGHRVHKFPKKTDPVFRVWVQFVKFRRSDFNATSVSKCSVICSAHFTDKDYATGDLNKFQMGCKRRIRLLPGAVPTILTPTATCVGSRPSERRRSRARQKRELSLVSKLLFRIA